MHEVMHNAAKWNSEHDSLLKSQWLNRLKFGREMDIKTHILPLEIEITTHLS